MSLLLVSGIPNFIRPRAEISWREARLGGSDRDAIIPWNHDLLCARKATFLEDANMIEQLTTPKEDILGFKLTGKLHDEDYKHFVPAIDAAIARHGKARVLAQFHDFHGWDMHALWDDIKFSTTHCTKIERIVVGRRENLGEMDGESM